MFLVRFAGLELIWLVPQRVGREVEALIEGQGLLETGGQDLKLLDEDLLLAGSLLAHCLNLLLGGRYDLSFLLLLVLLNRK